MINADTDNEIEDFLKSIAKIDNYKYWVEEVREEIPMLLSKQNLLTMIMLNKWMQDGLSLFQIMTDLGLCYKVDDEIK